MLDLIQTLSACVGDLGSHNLRRNEKSSLNKLNKDAKFRLKGRVQDVQAKLTTLIQASLSNRKMDNAGLREEAVRVVENGVRVCAAMLSYLNCDEIKSPAAAAALVLHKSLSKRCWQDCPNPLSQLVRRAYLSVVDIDVNY